MTMPALSGELHPRAKLTAFQVRTIRRTYAPGRITMHQLARQYGVTKQAISDVLAHRSWKSLEEASASGDGWRRPVLEETVHWD